MGGFKTNNEDTMKELASPIKDALTQRLNIQGDYILISVSLSDGVMTIQGRIIKIQN
jgi:osmotically-inducible protein OsmY